ALGRLRRPRRQPRLASAAERRPAGPGTRVRLPGPAGGDAVSAARVFERLTRVSPLGLRFWDVAAAAPAGDGLVVTAVPAAAPELPPPRAVPAFRTASGAFAFHGLPGLRGQENGAGDADYWAAVARQSFRVTVRDPRGWFVAFRFA